MTEIKLQFLFVFSCTLHNHPGLVFRVLRRDTRSTGVGNTRHCLILVRQISLSRGLMCDKLRARRSFLTHSDTFRPGFSWSTSTTISRDDQVCDLVNFIKNEYDCENIKFFFFSYTQNNCTKLLSA